MDSMRIIVNSGGSSKSYPAGPVVQVAFERKFETALPDAFGADGENRLEWMYWLAWKACAVAGDTPNDDADFDRWLATIEGIDVKAGDVAPFPPEPSGG